ncbi:MAG: hypothetical protein IPL89_16590 [Acidobacteria bacterium]|nr:hypothetical protein [Acidobacteriota bacterium]
MDDAVPDEEAYATRVEEAFIAERGTPFLLSPKDWTLIRGWRENGVPLDVVVRAVREAFEKRRARSQAGKISSIAYCASSVEELWEMERRGLVGKARETAVAGANAPAREESLALLSKGLRAANERFATAEGIEDFLRRVSEGGALLAAAAKVEALARDLPFEESESALSAIEAALLRSALKGLPPKQKELVESRVSAALGDVAGVSPAVVERMRRALTRREVRLLLGLPALTLLHG